jgi:hypothetical protein
MLRRDGTQIIAKPIESLEDLPTPINSNSSSREGSLERLTTDSKEDTPEADLADNAKRRRDSVGVESRASCEGPRLASALRERKNILEEGTLGSPAVAGISEWCCDTCSPQLWMANSILGDLKRVASLLEATAQHTIGGVELRRVQSYAQTLSDVI